MDLYSTTVLNRVVEELPANPAFLLNAFFTGVEVSDTPTIHFDVVKGNRRIAPFCSPRIAGKIVRERGFKTKAFAPAYIKDKREFDPEKNFTRRAGEKIGGSLNPEQRLQASINHALSDQLQMWTRRLEVMAAEALFTGALVIEGEDYETQHVDFERDPALSIVLPSGKKWNVKGVDPLDDIEEWCQLVFDKSRQKPTDGIMTSDVWKVIRSKLHEVKPDGAEGAGLPTEAARAMMARLDTTLSTLERTTMNLGPLVIQGEGAKLVAVFGTLRLWVYNDAHEDPESGAETPNLPPGSFMLVSTGLDGVRHFGAIKDLKAGLQPRAYFVKSWEVEDPSTRYILGQSAPLLVPYRVNATLGATVL